MASHAVVARRLEVAVVAVAAGAPIRRRFAPVVAIVDADPVVVHRAAAVVAVDAEASVHVVRHIEGRAAAGSAAGGLRGRDPLQAGEPGGDARLDGGAGREHAGVGRAVAATT